MASQLLALRREGAQAAALAAMALFFLTLAAPSFAYAQGGGPRRFDFDQGPIEGDLEGPRPDGVLLEPSPLRRDRPGAPGDLARLAARESALTPDQRVQFAELLCERGEATRIRGFEARERGLSASCDPACRAAAEAQASRLEVEADRDVARALDVLGAMPPDAPPPLMLRALDLRRFYLASLHRRDEATAVARRIMSLAPDSREASSSALFLADDAFERGALQDAISHYRSSLRSAAPSAAGYAHYKLAWCYFNLQQGAAALDELEVARDIALMQGSPGAAIAREAPRDFAMMLGGLSGPTATVCARLRRFAPIAAERESIARRYVELLRDVGREREAVEFPRECR